MNLFRADLHCHSTYSDGTLTPKEIIDLALEKGLQGLSITDHDSIDAYHEALPYAKARNFPLITGIEFSTLCRQTSVHLLAYSFSSSSKPIQDLCRLHKERRINRAQMILNLLSKEGFHLSLQEVIDSLSHPILPSSLGRPHIANAMIKKGYVSTLKEAFNKYLGDGKSCYVQSTAPSTESTLQHIKQANGIAIIGHPHLIKGAKILKNILSMPFDGIEGYYSRFPESQCAKWLQIAASKKWLVTGGSDSHGSITPDISLGSSWTNEETFTLLYNRWMSNQSSSLENQSEKIQ